MNLLKKIFPVKKTVSETPTPTIYNAHEQLLIEKIIEMVEADPEAFSARWFTGTSLDKSVQSADRNILIMIETGQIAEPIAPVMTKEQKEKIKALIKPIVKKDSEYLAERLICNCKKNHKND